MFALLAKNSTEFKTSDNSVRDSRFSTLSPEEIYLKPYIFKQCEVRLRFAGFVFNSNFCQSVSIESEVCICLT